jgi:hypothetical protein
LAGRNTYFSESLVYDVFAFLIGSNFVINYLGLGLGLGFRSRPIRCRGIRLNIYVFYEFKVPISFDSQRHETTLLMVWYSSMANNPTLILFIRLLELI